MTFNCSTGMSLSIPSVMFAHAFGTTTLAVVKLLLVQHTVDIITYVFSTRDYARCDPMRACIYGSFQLPKFVLALFSEHSVVKSNVVASVIEVSCGGMWKHLDAVVAIDDLFVPYFCLLAVHSVKFMCLLTVRCSWRSRRSFYVCLYLSAFRLTMKIRTRANNNGAHLFLLT